MTVWAREDPLNGGDILSNITDRISLTNIAADIPVTNLSPKTPGEYIVYVYGMCFTSDAAAGQVSLDLLFTDETGAQDVQLGSLSLASPNISSTIFLIRTINKIVSFSATHSGIFGTAKFNLIVICQKL
jgi:hypothetical protein